MTHTLQIELSDEIYPLILTLAKDRNLSVEDFTRLALYLLMEGQLDDQNQVDKLATLQKDWKAWSADDEAKQGLVEA